MRRKVVLIILDGWGIATIPEVSAIAQAATPFIDNLYSKYPHSTLQASGIAVGLPEGQMGNSEVGHMNIGAGRVVYQDLVKINKSIEEGELVQHKVLLEALQYAKDNNKKVHLIGLLSDGGVHAHSDHLIALCELAAQRGVGHQTFVHAFTDGRDTAPKSSITYLQALRPVLAETQVRLASVIGRYYAMDRDQRWERIKKAYDLLVHGKGEATHDILAAIEASYAAEVTDEFIAPIVCVNKDDQPYATIAADDVVISFNFRTDRGRQLTEALTQRDFPDYEMEALPLHYLTFTNYDDSFENIKVIFEKDHLVNTLGEVIAKEGLKQVRIAETEKYPHVTFFFSGGEEEAFKGEQRILCPSPQVATYDLQPEMSAHDITQAAIKELQKQESHFICLNFANPDMVGHTGVFEAAVEACTVVDRCTKEVVETAIENDYTVLIIADHGNADYMINDDGSPHTAHTTNLVPCILINDNQGRQLKEGILGNVAPTILALMDITPPKEMTESTLLQSS